MGRVASPTAEKSTLPSIRLYHFLVLVLFLSVPFWWIGWRVDGWQLPGRLPLSALMVVTPAAAGLILTWRDSGRPGIRAMLGRHRVRIAAGTKRWWVLSVAVMPAVLAVSFAPVMVTQEVDAIQLLPSLGTVGITFALFLVAAAIEEVGWTAYATDDAVILYGHLGAGIVLGAAWAAWHLVPWLQAGHPAGWVTAQSGFTILLRILQVLVYHRTGRSVVPSILLHATANLALIPGGGRLYDPVRASSVLLVVVLASAHGNRSR